MVPLCAEYLNMPPAVDPMPVFDIPVDGPLGFGWHSTYFTKIVNNDTYVDSEGRYITFKADSAGKFFADYENGLTLTKTLSGFELKERGGRLRVFDVDGKLKEAVKDPVGRDALVFTHGADHHIASAADRSGRKVAYGYDGFGNLVKVTDAAGGVYSYAYNSYHGLTSKTNPGAETYQIEYAYADRGVTGKVIDPVGSALRDSGGSSAGHETVYGYDYINKTFYVTGKNGRKLKKTLNDKGRLTSEEEVDGNVLVKKTEYLPGGLERHIDAAGNITLVQMDQWHNPVRVYDGEGGLTTITYNAEGRPASVTDPLGNASSFEYDASGTLALKAVNAVGKPEQSVAEFAYDNYGQLTSATRAGATASYSYDASGNLIKVIDPLGNATRYEYDGPGNRIASIDANGNRTEFSYDADGRLLSATDPLANASVVTYNAAGRPASMTDPLGRVTSVETDYSGRTTAAVDALGNRKEYRYDGEGNLTKMTQKTPSPLVGEGWGEGAVTTLAYDSSNRLLSITDAEGSVTAYEYAAPGACAACAATGGSTESPSRIIDPLGNATETIFDKNERITSVTDRNGNVISYAYDAAGRLLQKTYPDNTAATFTYDSLGRLLTASNNNTALTFAYDTFGRVTAFTDGGLNKTVAYEYDKNSRRTKMTDGEGRVTTYSYDGRNLLSAMDSAGLRFSFAYDQLGRRTGLAYPNGVNAAYAYDAASELTSLTNKLNAADATSNLYTYDPVGNRLTNTDLAGAHTYQYDGLYQLTQASHLNQETETFVYDKVGNRKAAVWAAAVADGSVIPAQAGIQYSYSAGNRIATSDGETYAHDNNGNIVSKTGATGTTAYAYDYENKLVKATMPDGAVAEYKYDALGRRIEKKVTPSVIASASEAISTTRYLYDGANAIAEYDVSNNLKTKYTHGLGIDDALAMEKSGAIYYYHKDGLGTITALTDSTGAAAQSYTYDAFGNITATLNASFAQPYTFTGREFDQETGLYYYRARYYDARTGRFISEDPIGFNGGDTNLYSYVGQNPVRYTDSIGLYTYQGKGKYISGGIGGVGGGVIELDVTSECFNGKKQSAKFAIPLAGITYGLPVGFAAFSLEIDDRHVNGGPDVSRLAGNVTYAAATASFGTGVSLGGMYIGEGYGDLTGVGFESITGYDLSMDWFAGRARIIGGVKEEPCGRN
ncbi:MAG: RHS repeat protein [Deltaproteobacteria bacterium]|nr:RHS repeat protein [Deltaproteobacteria bacterium]